MQGTVYKEIRQNSFYLICALLLPPLAYIVGALMTVISFTGRSDLGFTGNGPVMMKIIMLSIAYFGMGTGASSVFSNDETKRHSGFLLSAPNGCVRTMYGKYVFQFMAHALMFVSALFTDSLCSWLIYCFTGETPKSIMTFLLIMLFLQIFLRALENPFNARFGVKLAGILRTGCLVVLILAILMVFLFVPSAIKIYDSIGDIMLRLADGELTRETAFAVSLFPLISMSVYIISWRISCRVWKKGVANYER